MAAVILRKVPPGVVQLEDTDHLPSVRRLRVQVVTNSKGYVELNLNNRGLRIVPPETFQLTNTQVLRLDQNYVDYLPSMIAYLRGLRVLDLQRNVLVQLPETLVNCKHMAELRLTGNRLSSLPRSFGGLKNLRILELGENQLEQLPHEVGLLHSLRTLDLHSNRLWHLPFSLQELRHLLNFNLSDNMFDHVPLVVTKITSIRALNLSKNRLGALPLDMDALKGLRELNLSHNKMAAVTSVLVTLTHLKYLSLAHNGLKFLPSRMSQLQNLRVLHLQCNELRHVPSCLRRLRFYNVSSNRIQAFSVEGMRALVSITASKNRLETVPRGLYKLKHLKFLSLDGNVLVELGEDVGALKQLKVLDLSHNNLQGLPKALHRLPLLQTFNVKGNYALTKRKSRRTEEKTMPDGKGGGGGGRREPLKTRGVVEFKDERCDDDDVDDDDYTNDHDQDDDDDDDEGVWMGGNDTRVRNGSMENVRLPGYHGDQGTLQLSSKSLDDLTHLAKPRSRSRHLPERSGERKRQRVPHGTKSSSSLTQMPSKMFVGRGVALPSKNKQTTVKRMTSSNFANQSSVRKTPRSAKHDGAKGDTNKSKMFNKGGKSLKEMIFGKKSKHKSADASSLRGLTADTTKMKSSNSVHLPLEYTADEIDRGWEARTGSARTQSRVSGHVEESLEDKNVTRNKAKMTRHQNDDVRDWKSVSHGYGSWRSRTQMLWDIEASSQGLVDGYDHNKMTQATTGTPPYRQSHRTVHSKPRNKSASSDTLASDFTYQKFGGKPDRAPSRQSSNASRYLKEKQNNYYVTPGNERFSVTSGQGRDPRPSSRSKWLGQWFGPDYESSLTAGSEDGTERVSRSHDYSVREARASFATETTMDAQNRHFQHAQYATRRNGSYSNPIHLYSGGYLYRPVTHLEVQTKRKHASTESLHTHNLYDQFSNFAGSHEYPPLSRRPASHGCHDNRPVSEWIDSSLHQSEARSHLHRKSERDGFDDLMSHEARSSTNSFHGDGKGRQPHRAINPGMNTPHRDNGLDIGQRKSEVTPFSRSKSFHDFDNILTTRQPEVKSRMNGDPVESPEVMTRSDKGAIKQLDENFALRKKSEIPRSKSVNSLHEEGGMPPSALTPVPVSRGASVSRQGRQLNRTDYTLLGVCNQIESLLNKNLLQPVIGFKGSHRFEDKRIQEKSTGIWRMGDSLDNNDDNDDDGDDDDDEGGDDGGDAGRGRQGDDHLLDKDADVQEVRLGYSQPQTFKVTSTGGQFVTGERPEVKVTVPAHSVSKHLQITIQTLTIAPSLLHQAKRLNQFIDNITAIGPVVYFYLTEDRKLNSPASFTLPAPASVKGSHLSVLTIRRDNSCMPCSSAFRSSHSEVTVTAWHFTA